MSSIFSSTPVVSLKYLLFPRRTFNLLFDVWKCDGTLSFVCDVFHSAIFDSNPLFFNSLYYRFDQLIEYGQKMVASNPRVKQLRDRVAALKQEKVALKDTWSERNDVLHEGQDLQVSR